MTPDPEQVERVVQVLIAQRGGVQRGDEVEFRCIYPERHQHGDADASASFNIAKAVWCCRVCEAKGGLKQLAQLLGLVDAAPPRQRETGRWTIRDPGGTPVAVHVRREPGRKGRDKDCPWFHPDGRTPGIPGGLKSAQLPLYGVEHLKDHPGAQVVVVEGEKACDALTRRGVLAVATVTGAKGTPDLSVLRALEGHGVVRWCDADEPGRTHMRRIAAQLTKLRVDHALFDPWPDRTDGADAADWTHSTDALRAALDAVALLDGDLDEPTGHTKPEAHAADAPPVPLTALLAQVEQALRRYVVFVSDAQVVAVTLWAVHAHVIEAFDVTPYLNPRSAEKRSGKTRLLEVLNELVPRPWMTTQPSEAVLYRMIARDMPTLLLDEADAVFRGPPTERTEGLRAILNAGYRRGVTVARCAGKHRDQLDEFVVFCAKLLAGIGRLPDTVNDRCIPIILRRKKPGEPVARFRQREFAKVAAPIRKALARWATEALDVLRAARPSMPESLHDRAAEVCEPLVAIAELAGEDWPTRARDALKALFGDAEDESVNVRLLGAIRDVFTERNTDRILTGYLLEALVVREGEPWAGWWAREVAQATKDDDTPRKAAMELAKHLKPFGVQPGKLRVGDQTGNGYRRLDFDDAFSRYLPPVPEEGWNVGTTVAAQGLDAFRPAAGGTEVGTPETPGGQGLFRRSDLGSSQRPETKSETAAAPLDLPLWWGAPPGLTGAPLPNGRDSEDAEALLTQPKHQRDREEFDL